jgi:hypothetical protein
MQHYNIEDIQELLWDNTRKWTAGNKQLCISTKLFRNGCSMMIDSDHRIDPYNSRSSLLNYSYSLLRSHEGTIYELNRYTICSEYGGEISQSQGRIAEDGTIKLLVEVRIY